jgi:uncharacterized protein YjaZ
MNTNHTPKHTALEAKAIIDQMVATTGMSIQQIAEVNGCTCGYELQKKIMSDLNEQK